MRHLPVAQVAGKVTTGNHLREPISGACVLIASERAVKGVLPRGFSARAAICPRAGGAWCGIRRWMVRACSNASAPIGYACARAICAPSAATCGWPCIRAHFRAGRWHLHRWK